MRVLSISLSGSKFTAHVAVNKPEREKTYFIVDPFWGEFNVVKSVGV